MNPEPIVFALTKEEAEIAAARAAWRDWLGGGFARQRATTLVAFALALALFSTLGLTGVVSRRAAEILLILSILFYMLAQRRTRLGLAAARRRGADWAQDWGKAGETQLTLDDEGFTLHLAPPLVWRFADGLEIEAGDDLCYVWPRAGRPLVWPRRAHRDTEASEAFIAFARVRSSCRL